MARPNNTGALASHIQGLREAKAAFQALPQIIRDNMLVATETTVREIARLAQARLIASPAIRTRALHDHVKWQVTKTSGRGRVGVAAGQTTIVIGGRRKRVKGVITAGRGGSASTAAGASRVVPSRYAHLVEFGTRHSKAEPFMMPAAHSQVQPHLQRCKAAGKGIERDMSKVGARTL